MSKIREIYLKLCMTSVFRSVTEKPLFKHFSSYSKSDTTDEKIKAYAAFVSEIYLNGGSLSSLVFKLACEDENMYIKSRAAGNQVPEQIRAALSYELKALQELSLLKAEDFMEDMGVEYAAPYATEVIDFEREYEQRVREVKRFGYGIFSSYRMFRLADSGEIEPIISADRTEMDKFVGYEEERGKVYENTVGFLKGHPAANVLLCGDAGTGKSSTVKATVNKLYDKGLRLIELRKDQLHFLPYVMGKISENPLRFIIFIDDLSFNRSDDNFSMLKAALEGSASARADNALIYATSNRRHIIKESFSDREGNDVHINDTLQETLSLSERFGLVVLFSKPSKALYLSIVHTLAKRADIKMPEGELDVLAEAFALRKGSRSARCAEQFIQSLL